MPDSGNRSLYDILAVPSDAGRERLEHACWHLWDRYHSKSRTPLWEEVNRQIDQIHDTLLDRETRAKYDQALVRKREGPSHLSASGTTASLQSGPQFKRYLKQSFYFAGTSAGVLFHWLLDAISPSSWSEMMDIGGLSIFASGAMSGLFYATKAAWSAGVTARR